MRTILGGVLGKIPIPTPAMLVALLALLVAASGAAVAAIPSATGTITACYAKSTGALRVIDTGQTCTSKETQLAWKDGSTLLGKNEKAADSDKLDNKDSTEFLGANQKATDADKIDGQDSTAFLGATQKASDAEHADRADYSDNAGEALFLGGRTKDDFYAAGSTVANSYALEGKTSSDFLGRNEKAISAFQADRADTATNAQNAANADTLDGKDSTSFLGKNDQAADSARLGGLAPASYGGVVTGRINRLPINGSVVYGPVTGISAASADQSSVETLSPGQTLVLRDFAVRLSGSMGGSGIRGFDLVIRDLNGSTSVHSLGCTMTIPDDFCATKAGVTIPGGSTISLRISSTPTTDTHDALFGYRLTTT